MDDKLFEEKMQKLKNSYEHISTVSSAQKIVSVVKKNEKPFKRGMFLQLPYVASFIGVLLIGGILGAQLLSQTNDETRGENAPIETINKQPVTDGDIETAINQTRGFYERKLDGLRKELNFEDVEQYGFIQEAKSAVEKFEQRKTYASQAELSTYIEKVKEIITYRVSIPQEEYKLLQQVANNGETISDSQIYSYIDKLDMLHERFHEQWVSLYEKNQHTITDIESYVDELNNEEVITDDQQYFELVHTIRAYGYSFFHEGEGYINFAPDYTNIHNQLEKSLKDDTKLYLQLKSEKKALFDGAIGISHKELGNRLLEIEDFVLNNPSSPKVEEFKEQYDLYMSYYLKGSNNTKFVTDDNKIKDEMKTNFELLINENEFSETAKTVKWFYQQLEVNDFILTEELRAKEIERSEVLKPQSEEYSIEKHLLPITDEMITRYKEFKENGEMAIFDEPFGGLNSIDLVVARIYMYAIEKGDYQTAYKLITNGTNATLPTQEEFIKEMQESQIDYQALSNEVNKMRTNYEQEMIEHIFIKKSSETESLRMRLENGYPKIEYNPR